MVTPKEVRQVGTNSGGALRVFAYSKHPCWKVGVGKGGCEMTIRKEFSVSTRPVVLHVASMMGVGEGRNLGQCGEPQVPAASWVQK